MWRADSFEMTVVLGRLKGRGEGDDRGWDGWVASPTQWTWVWVNSGSWWWTGRLGMLRSMGSQRVGYNQANELNWSDPVFVVLVTFWMCPKNVVLTFKLEILAKACVVMLMIRGKFPIAKRHFRWCDALLWPKRTFHLIWYRIKFQKKDITFH